MFSDQLFVLAGLLSPTPFQVKAITLQIQSFLSQCVLSRIPVGIYLGNTDFSLHRYLNWARCNHRHAGIILSPTFFFHNAAIFHSQRSDLILNIFDMHSCSLKIKEIGDCQGVPSKAKEKETKRIRSHIVTLKVARSKKQKSLVGRGLEKWGHNEVDTW